MTLTEDRWRLPDAPLRGRVLTTQALGLALVAWVAFAVRAELSVGALYPFKALAVFAVVAVTAVGLVRGRHPFPRFGPANHTTTLRAALVALVAGLIADPADSRAAASAVVATLLIEALDGLDGWLARRTGMSSEFGARYDMEVDSLLGVVLAGLAWQYEKAGPWILLAGLLRYLFVAAGWLLPFLRQPLPPSRRRQVICVFQIIGLATVIAPVVAPPLSSLLAAVVLVVLSYSFAIDVAWLSRASARLTSGPKLEYR
jgi:phosphatidylglycerophosphate synthase